MDQDSVNGRWDILRSRAKSWWGRLTEADVEQATDMTSLTGLLQDRYGYSNEAALLEINRRIAEYEAESQNKTHPHQAD